MSAKLIPPQHEPVAVWTELIAAGLGAVVGAVVGTVMWLLTGELEWLYAVPICALLGPAVRRYCPTVLWGNRAP